MKRLNSFFISSFFDEKRKDKQFMIITILVYIALAFVFNFGSAAITGYILGRVAGEDKALLIAAIETYIEEPKYRTIFRKENEMPNDRERIIKNTISWFMLWPINTFINIAGSISSFRAIKKYKKVY